MRKRRPHDQSVEGFLTHRSRLRRAWTDTQPAGRNEAITTLAAAAVAIGFLWFVLDWRTSALEEVVVVACSLVVGVVLLPLIRFIINWLAAAGRIRDDWLAAITHRLLAVEKLVAPVPDQVQSELGMVNAALATFSELRAEAGVLADDPLHSPDTERLFDRVARAHAKYSRAFQDSSIRSPEFDRDATTHHFRTLGKRKTLAQLERICAELDGLRKIMLAVSTSDSRRGVGHQET